MLKKISRLREEIENQRDRLVTLQEQSRAIVPILDGLPHTKRQESKIEKYTLLIAECEERIFDLREKFSEVAFAFADWAMENLDGTAASAMVMRYVAGKSYGEIVKELKIPKATVYRIIRRAERAVPKY